MRYFKFIFLTIFICYSLPVAAFESDTAQSKFATVEPDGEDDPPSQCDGGFLIPLEDNGSGGDEFDTSEAIDECNDWNKAHPEAQYDCAGEVTCNPVGDPQTGYCCNFSPKTDPGTGPGIGAGTGIGVGPGIGAGTGIGVGPGLSPPPLLPPPSGTTTGGPFGIRSGSPGTGPRK